MKVSEKELALTEIDRTYWDRGLVLAGMDEVGRGPLAGPVVVGCVVMPPEPLLPYINDSKKLSEKRREALYEQIMETSLAHATAWVGPEVIDEINILEATKRGFAEAFSKIVLDVTDVLIDALRGLDIPARQHPLIHGDALSYSIGAASILAKVARDRYMIEQDALYPQYGFARNKGYGTAEHIAALKEYGPCPIHRRSFIGRLVSLLPRLPHTGAQLPLRSLRDRHRGPGAAVGHPRLCRSEDPLQYGLRSPSGRRHRPEAALSHPCRPGVFEAAPHPRRPHPLRRGGGLHKPPPHHPSPRCVLRKARSPQPVTGLCFLSLSRTL